MEIINKRLSLEEFKLYIQSYNFGRVLPDKIVIHHTWRPKKADWRGETSVLGLKAYYERKGWPAGPHMFVAEDGIWLFSPMNKDGIHAGSLNKLSVGIEVVGDYDEKVWEGETKKNALGVIKSLKNQLNLSTESIFFHRDVSAKSCPGRAITKSWLFAELRGDSRPRIPAISAEHRLPTDEEVEVISTVSVRVPDWAQASVDWVRENKLFEVRSPDDVRDAVKFHRLYKILSSNT